MKIKHILSILNKINNYYPTLGEKERYIILNSDALVLENLDKVDIEMLDVAISLLLENHNKKELVFLLNLFHERRNYPDVIKEFLTNEIIKNNGSSYLKNGIELISSANSEFVALKVKDIIENSNLMYRGFSFEPDSLNYANFLVYTEQRIISDYFFWPNILTDEYFIKEKLTDSFIEITDDYENAIDLSESINKLDIYFSKKENFQKFFNHLFNKYFDTLSEKLAYLKLLFRLLCKYNFDINLDDYNNGEVVKDNEINSLTNFIKYFNELVRNDSVDEHHALEEKLSKVIDDNFEYINIFSKKQRILKK